MYPYSYFWYLSTQISDTIQDFYSGTICMGDLHSYGIKMREKKNNVMNRKKKNIYIYFSALKSLNVNKLSCHCFVFYTGNEQ